MHGQDVAQLASLAHPADLLAHGVVAEIVKGAVGEVLLLGEIDELLGFCRRRRERLFADDVLTRQKSIARNREVERVWGTDMDCIDRGVREEGAVVAGVTLDSDLVGKGPRQIVGRGGNARDLHIAQAADGFRMGASHKPGSENSCSDFLH